MLTRIVALRRLCKLPVRWELTPPHGEHYPSDALADSITTPHVRMIADKEILGVGG
jgi:hypothetical protein